MTHTKHLIQFVLGALLVCAAVAVMCAGCSTMRDALYDRLTVVATNSDGTFIRYLQLTPKAEIKDAVQSAGGVLGPYGIAGAGLTLSILSLAAHWLNRRAKAAAEKDMSRGVEARAGPS
jgi:hypothetical protein